MSTFSGRKGGGSTHDRGRQDYSTYWIRATLVVDFSIILYRYRGWYPVVMLFIVTAGKGGVLAFIRHGRVDVSACFCKAGWGMGIRFMPGRILESLMIASSFPRLDFCHVDQVIKHVVVMCLWGWLRKNRGIGPPYLWFVASSSLPIDYFPQHRSDVKKATLID